MAYNSNIYSRGQRMPVVIRKGGSVKHLKPYQDLCFAHGNWCNGHHSVDKLNLTNQVFEFYYLAINSINKSTSKKAIKKEVLIGGLMEGYGIGIRDLDDLYKHIIANGGDWIDDTGEHFYDDIFLSRGAIDLPMPIANFSVHMSGKLKPLKENISYIGGQIKTMNPSNVGEVLQSVVNRCKIIEHLVFFDSMENPHHRTSTKYAGRVAGKVSSFGSVLGIMDTAMKDYVAAMRANNSNVKGSLAYASLTTVLGLVPVLGSFYAEMARFLTVGPGFIKSALNVNRRYLREKVGMPFKDL